MVLSDAALFVYNASYDRVKMSVYNQSLDVITKYYSGSEYELHLPYSGSSKEILYLGGDAYSAPAVYVKQANSGKIYYICRDYLGSITHIMNSDGTLEQELSYDAWGRLRDPDTHTVYATANQPVLFLGRGYTGHEHLPTFGLINMNARLYDPVLGRFLNVDPYVQFEDFTQRYNRYSYCHNNPLLYVDQNGEFIHLLIGAVVGGIFNWIVNGCHFNLNGLASFGIGALGGAVASGFGTGIGALIGGGSFSAAFIGGTAASVSSTGFFAGAGASFTGGFITQAGNSWMNGSNFGNGLLNGLKAGGIASLSGGIMGGIIGGIEAVSKGTNFFTGIGKFDLSKGYAPHGPIPDEKTVTGKYKGMFEDVNVYESSMFPDGAAVTLPGRGIVTAEGIYYGVRKGFSDDVALLQHEYGHILQARMFGLKAFYSVIAPESLASASLDGVLGHKHSTFWTETWANYLSKNYFGTKTRLLDANYWPARNINLFNTLRLIRARY